MTLHKQVPISQYEGGPSILVDEGIAELLKFLWDLGIETLLSCEGSRIEYAWIMFKDGFSLKTFLNSVAKYPDENYLKQKNVKFCETLCARIASDEYSAPHRWIYSLTVHDRGVISKIVHHNPPATCGSLLSGKSCKCLDGDTEVIDEFTGKHDFVMVPSVRFHKSDIKLLLEILKRRVHVSR